VEPVAWAFRQVTSVTAAAPSRQTARTANVDRDITAGTVQNQVRMLSAVAQTRRPTKREIEGSTRITLSAGVSAGRRTDTWREAFRATVLFSEAGGRRERRKAQERISSLSQLFGALRHSPHQMCVRCYTEGWDFATYCAALRPYRVALTRSSRSSA
jgi:hypothetical protein